EAGSTYKTCISSHRARSPARDESLAAESRVATLDHDAALVFETRVLVGTKKPKEYGARLVFGEGKITVVPTDDPGSILYSIPYGRVTSISYSHGRDPL